MMIAQSKKVQILILLFVSAVMFFLRLDSKHLMDNEESRFALQARTMIETGDWVVPRWSYRPHGTKPPLFTWTVAALSKVAGGVSEWTARLPSALAALGTVLFLFFVGNRLFGSPAGFLGALILSTAFLFWDSARFARSDMLLTFFMTLSIGFIILGAEEERGAGAWMVGAFVAAALGTMSKGPVGTVLPALTGFLYLTLRTRWSQFPGWSYAAGVLILLVIILPWYWVYARAAGGEHLWEMLFRQNVTRYLSAFDHKNPVYFYAGYFPPNSIPWMGLVLAALGYGASRNWRTRDSETLIFLWWACVFLFFSLSTSKRPSYILPALPPAALLTGHFLAYEVFGKENGDWTIWGRLGFWLFAVTFAGMIFGGVGFPIWAGLAEPELLTSAAAIGALFAAAGAVALWLLKSGHLNRAVGVFLAGILVVQVAAQWTVVPYINSRLSTAGAARDVVRTADGAHIVSYRLGKASLALYGPKGLEDGKKAGEFYFFRQPWRLRYFLKDFQGTAYIFMLVKDYRSMPEDLRSMMEVVRRDIRFGDRHRTVLLRNRPFRPAAPQNRASQDSYAPAVHDRQE